MITVHFVLGYLWDILFGWFGLAVLLLGANDVLKWLWPRWASSQPGTWLHEHRWKICIALFVLAQGLAYRDLTRQVALKNDSIRELTAKKEQNERL